MRPRHLGALYGTLSKQSLSCLLSLRSSWPEPDSLSVFLRVLLPPPPVPALSWFLLSARTPAVSLHHPLTCQRGLVQIAGAKGQKSAYCGRGLLKSCFTCSAWWASSIDFSSCEEGGDVLVHRRLLGFSPLRGHRHGGQDLESSLAVPAPVMPRSGLQRCQAPAFPQKPESWSFSTLLAQAEPAPAPRGLSPSPERLCRKACEKR